MLILFVVFLVFSVPARGKLSKIVLTNDDGWAVAQIRAQRDALTSAGFDVCPKMPCVISVFDGAIVYFRSFCPSPCTE